MPPRRAKGGHARRSLATLYRKGQGKLVSSRAPFDVSEKHRTTTARAPPSEREALWSSKSCPTWMSHSVFVSGTLMPSTPPLTPTGGNRRSFRGRRSPDFPAGIGRSSSWRHRGRHEVRELVVGLWQVFSETAGLVFCGARRPSEPQEAFLGLGYGSGREHAA